MLMRRSKNAEANKAYPVIAIVLFQCEYKDLAQPNNFISLFTVQLWFVFLENEAKISEKINWAMFYE